MDTRIPEDHVFEESNLEPVWESRDAADKALMLEMDAVQEESCRFTEKKLNDLLL